MNVICPECGARNRIPEQQQSGVKYRCARCKTQLALTEPATVIPSDSKMISRHPSLSAIRNCYSNVARAVATIMKTPLLHPPFFAMFPILYLYSSNVIEVNPPDIIMPLSASLGLAALLLCLSWIIFKSLAKASAFTTLFLIIFFNFGDFTDLSESLPWQAVFAICIALLIGCAFLLIKTKRALSNLMVFLNVVALILVIFPTVDIVSSETSIARHDFTIYDSQIDTMRPEDRETLPDIYFLVFDRYGSNSALSNALNIDNNAFTDWLIDKGFYVASNSTSNYPRTYGSLTSFLNMEYINYLSDELGEDFNDLAPMHEMIQDNRVCLFLKSKGYKYIHCGDNWGATALNRNADENYSYFRGIDNFSWLLFENTLVYPILKGAKVIEDFRLMRWKNVRFVFSKLAEIPDYEAPTFVFAHMLIPHEPFCFESDGSYSTVDRDFQTSLDFVNTELMMLVELWLSKSEVPPIIILQADEGPLTEIGWLGEEANAQILKNKMGILNAYYLGGYPHDVLYPSITPVNSFRVVFNLLFGSTYDLLPDRNYTYYLGGCWPYTPYKFIDVTDKVQSN